MQRIKKYNLVSTGLSLLSNAHLSQILANGKPMHNGIGGKSALISIDDIPVFVKCVPLTDLEKQPQHFMSTGNIYDLPLYYQYGVGSAGFGVWRELVTHAMTTNWVISGECENFPIMYHYRILPGVAANINTSYWDDIEKYCRNWENSVAIRRRVIDLNNVSDYIAIFLEYIPENLHSWLHTQIINGDDNIEKIILFIDKQLKKTNKFINTHGLMHFDAHFENILTDGKRLYFSDFGLALSSKFDLSSTETDFINLHESYDQACAAVNLLHCIITTLFGNENWDSRLREYLAGEVRKLPPEINSIINRYAPIALLMDEFFKKPQQNKFTLYPATQIEKLINTGSSEHDAW